MGLSIHYRGWLRNKAALPKLVEEVTDIVRIYQWPYEIFETEFPHRSFGEKTHTTSALYGMRFTPPECETISLCFLSNGKLICFWSWVLYLKSQGVDNELLTGGVSVKTQYAGEAIHKITIHLLDHLSKKHFKEFTLKDEGQYWETHDEALLSKNFNHLAGLIQSFGAALDANPLHPGESFEKYFERLLRKIYPRTQE